MELLEPKEITLPTQSSGDRTYTLHKFDAITGREIISKYPVANMPKVGEYQTSEATMRKLMAFVTVNGTPLKTDDLIKNHVPDWEVLMRLEWAMLEYNCSFFANGKLSDFLQNLGEKPPEWISRILTGLSGRSSQAGTQPSAS